MTSRLIIVSKVFIYVRYGTPTIELLVQLDVMIASCRMEVTSIELNCTDLIV